MFLKYDSKYASADIKYYSPGSTRDVENPISSISHYSEEVTSRAGSHEPIPEISKKANLSRCVTSLSLISFLKTEKRLIYRTIVSCLRSSENVFQHLNKQENKTTSNSDQITLLICTKVPVVSL